MSPFLAINSTKNFFHSLTPYVIFLMIELLALNSATNFFHVKPPLGF